MREWRKIHYQADRQRLAEQRWERKGILAESIGGKCCDCEWAPTHPKQWAAMDFHHREPSSKSFTIGGAKRRSMDALLAEAAKCDLLCARCHRIRHALK
jgi:hypothetical protein